MYSKRLKETSFDNGIIYPVVNKTIKILFYLNIVEWLKKISDYFTLLYFKNKTTRLKGIKTRRNKNIVIDLFIVAKFYFLLIILFNQSDMVWVQTIVWYLLLSNVYTYFYYHLWCEDALLETFQTIHRVRRRFINLFVSVLFMMLCYVYFYSIMIPKHFSLENSESNNIMISFIYAIAQSFAVDYEGMKSVSNIGATGVSIVSWTHFS